MKKFVVALVAACLGSSAAAQTISYDGTVVSFAFNFNNDNGAGTYRENFVTQVSGALSYSIGETYGLDVIVGSSFETYDDTPFAKKFTVGMNPFVRIENGRVGPYVVYLSQESQNDRYMLGLEGSYSLGAMELEGYAAIDRLRGQDEDDRTNLGLAASYGLTDLISSYVAIRRDNSVTFDAHLTLFTLGTTFDLRGPATNLPLAISTEWSRYSGSGLSFSDSDWNQFSVIAAYTFGKARRSVFHDQRSTSTYFD
jgi:hypothetical protein